MSRSFIWEFHFQGFIQRSEGPRSLDLHSVSRRVRPERAGDCEQLFPGPAPAAAWRRRKRTRDGGGASLAAVSVRRSTLAHAATTHTCVHACITPCLSCSRVQGLGSELRSWSHAHASRIAPTTAGLHIHDHYIEIAVGSGAHAQGRDGGGPQAGVKRASAFAYFPSPM